MKTYAFFLLLMAMLFCSTASHAVELPNPAKDQTATGMQSLVVAGGCFWGVQAVFQHVKGVEKAISGYAGGDAKSADYETVSTGRTGHAEAVQITYDPKQVSLGQLLKIFFSVAHDPTELNRQGPDTGTQYRSAVFTSSPEQADVAKAYIAQLNAAKVFPQPIVTEVTELKGFYPAEAYHQDYMKRNPDNRYIVINDAPKVASLKKLFPGAYKED
jgi:peptide-methionine (S)-S-oxide reductase